MTKYEEKFFYYQSLRLFACFQSVDAIDIDTACDF